MFNNSAEALASTLQALAAEAEAIQEPANYYVGLPDPGVQVPANVLLFCRQRLRVPTGRSHHHRFVLIINLVTAGGVIVDDLVFAFQPGDVLLVHPWQFHGYADVHGKAMCWLFATFEGVAPEPLLALRNVTLRLSPIVAREVSAMLAAYRAHPESATHAQEVSLRLGLVLTHLAQQASPRRRGRARKQPYALVEKVNRYILEHVAEPLELNTVAQALAMSQSHLRNRFKAVAGISLGRHMRRVRIHRACTLLGTTDATVSEVAEACGFQSLYAFSRAFKQALGMAPSAFRNAQEAAR